MKKEKLEEGLREVLDEIEAALHDTRGLLAHQRRLAFSLSLGSTILSELYFQKLTIMKLGAKINHTWFKKKKENVIEALQPQITTPLDSVAHIDTIITLMIMIEEKRDDLAYGAPSTEKVLQDKINLFFELKRVIQC